MSQSLLLYILLCYYQRIITGIPSWIDLSIQGDHLSGKPWKPGNVRELYRCQGNVRSFTKSHGNVREKILSWKFAQKLNIFHYSVAVDGSGFYDVIIMKSLSLNMNLTVWSLTLTLVVQAWYEYLLKWSGVPQIVREMSGNFIVSGEWSPCPMSISTLSLTGRCNPVINFS